MTYERVRVGDVLQLERRPVAVDMSLEYVEVGVRSFGKGLFHKEPIVGAAIGNKRVFEIHPDDLVISNVFAWEGAIAVASPAEAGTIGSHRFMTFRPRDARIDQRWAAWFLRSEPGLDLVGKASPGSAGRNRTLAIDRFESMEIPLPPIDQQRLTAERLDGMEAAATELRSKTAHADALNDALVVALALRPDLDDTTKQNAGWTHTPLREVLSPSDRTVPLEPAGRYLVAGIYSFGRGLIDRGLIQGAETSYATMTRLAAGDVVVSKLNGWEGAVAVVGDEFDGFHVSSEYPTFVPDRARLLPGFFAGIARAPSFWDDLNVSARGSMVRRRRINPAEFLSTRVWLPPLEVQAATAEALATAAETSRTRRASSERIDALVPAALNEAFAGIS